MRRAAARAALLLGLACLAGGSARASDGPAPSVLGARGPVALPMGGDPQSAFRMPSGVGWSLQSQVDLDLFLAWYRSSAENRLNDLVKEGVGGALSLGAVLVPDEEGPFTLHLGIYPELGALSPSRTKVHYETIPHIGLRADTMFVTLAGGVAFAPTRWLSFGASAHVIPVITQNRLLLGGSGGGQTLELAGSPAINGVPLPGNPTYAEFLRLVPQGAAADPTLIYEAKGEGLHLSGLVSVTLCPSERFAVGLAYRPRSFDAVPLGGEAEIDASLTVDSALGGLPGPVRQLFLATLPDGGRNGWKASYQFTQEGPYVPQQVRLSLAWWPSERVLLAGEVVWTDWHGAFGEATISLTEGSNRDFNWVVGSSRVVVRAPTRWHSRWTASGQVAWRVLDPLTLRLGFHYGESPLNPQVLGSISTPSLACSSLFLGTGWQLTRDLQLNALVEWVLPTKARAGLGTGAPTTDGTRYTADQLVLHLGLSVWF